MENKTLFFGDNLDILRDKFQDNSVDLIYLDPPFNSKRGYNILFKEGLVESQAQVRAFEDSWSWTRETEKIFEELVTGKSKTQITAEISNLIKGFKSIIGQNDVMAYLVMMTLRLIELHKVLKPTGSLYLHCDPTASHYLKIILDVIFGKKNFRNEIIWKRTNSPKSQTEAFGNQHDVLLFYTKSDKFTFHNQFRELDEASLKPYRYQDEKGKFQTVAIIAGGIQKYAGRKKFEFRGVTAQWLYTKDNLEKFWKQGLIHKTKSGYRLKKYLKDVKGLPISDLWVDKGVSPLQSAEWLGFQTQKPEALLERIILTSSNKGDLILDAFCGCGTTISVAEKLERKWVGIDITNLAINIMKHRLQKQFNFTQRRIKVDIEGIPKDLAGAKELATKDRKGRFEFEYWALGLVNALPKRSKEKMYGADEGIDGILVIKTSEKELQSLIVQVKSGKVKRDYIATLKGDVQREGAIGGVLITLQEPTKSMIEESNKAGFFESLLTKEKYPKIQIITIKELFDGKRLNLPNNYSIYKDAKEVKLKSSGRQKKLTF